VIWPIAIFAVLMGGYYAAEYMFLIGGNPLKGYLVWIASTTAKILTFLGHEAASKGAWVGTAHFKAEIVHGCDALEPTAAFAAAVVASPVAFGRKIPGLIVGIIGLLLVNLIRIVTLFFIGEYFPGALDIMHYDIWQAAFIVLAIVFWAIWVQLATREGPTRPHDTN